MQPQNQNQALDPSVVNLVKAIGTTESGGNYNARGASGEYGAYQFLPSTWQKWAGQWLGDENAPMTKENQDQVAYKQVESWGKQGYKPAQIASLWNSGKPDWQGNVGTNAKGVHYDTPQYVKSVGNVYSQLQTGSKHPFVAPTTSTVGANGQLTGATPGQQQPQDSNENLLEKIINFAFPIAGDVAGDIHGTNQKSALQQLGDVGLSALWFAPLAGPEASVGARLLGETGGKVAAQALGGAAVGYGADVAGNLANGQTGQQVLTPGLGTLTGGAVGGALGKLASYAEPDVVKAIAKSNNDVLGQTKPGGLRLATSAAGGKDTGLFLAQKGINLNRHIDPATVSYDVQGVATGLRNDAKTLDSALTDGLKGTSQTVNLNEEEQKALQAIAENPAFNKTASKLQAAQQYVKDQFSAEKARWGKAMPLANFNEFKSGQWAEAKFDATKPSFAPLVHRTIGNSAKTTIEDVASKSGLEGVKEMNEYIGNHYDAANALYNGKQTGRLHGTKAKGGRLGNSLREASFVGGGLAAGSGIGASLGGALGGGPVGALAGAIIGHYGNKALTSVLRKAESAPIKSAILRNMTKQDPAVVSKVLQFAKQSPMGKKVAQEKVDELEKLAQNLGTKYERLPGGRGKPIRSVDYSKPQAKPQQKPAKKTAIAPMLQPAHGRSPVKGLVSRVARAAAIKGVVQ